MYVVDPVIVWNRIAHAYCAQCCILPTVVDWPVVRSSSEPCFFGTICFITLPICAFQKRILTSLAVIIKKKEKRRDIESMRHRKMVKTMEEVTAWRS